MKKSLFYSVLLLFLFACEDGSQSQLETDPLGWSEFFIQNNSSRNINVTINYLEELPSTEESIISNGQLDLGDFGGGIGIHAFPEDYISEIVITDALNSSDTLFTDVEIKREEWQHKTPNGYVWWEYAQYTFVIDDGLFE